MKTYTKNLIISHTPLKYIKKIQLKFHGYYNLLRFNKWKIPTKPSIFIIYIGEKTTNGRIKLNKIIDILPIINPTQEYLNIKKQYQSTQSNIYTCYCQCPQKVIYFITNQIQKQNQGMNINFRFKILGCVPKLLTSK